MEVVYTEKNKKNKINHFIFYSPRWQLPSFTIVDCLEKVLESPLIIIINFNSFIPNQRRSQNLKLGGAALPLVVCSDFGFRLRCYLVV